MATIADVKTWYDTARKEWRVYVHTSDGREGCRYITGSYWHPKGSQEGTLTKEEWAEARKLACVDGKWQMWQATKSARAIETGMKQATSTVLTNKKPGRCMNCDILLQPGQGGLVHYSEDDIEDFGLFDLTPGWHVYCLDTDACKARVEAAKEQARIARERQAAFDAAVTAIRQTLQERGERPEVDRVNGERLLDTRNIYGGGSAFVVEPDGTTLWYVQGNGADGDDWSYNNLAGAIGWRLEHAEELIAALRELAQQKETNHAR